MNYVILALLGCLTLFCLIAGVVAKRREQQEPVPTEDNLDDLMQEVETISFPEDIGEFGESSILEIAPENVASAFSPTIGAESQIGRSYELLFSMYSKLIVYLADNDIDFPNEFSAFQPLEFGSAEAYPFVKPELISVSPAPVAHLATDFIGHDIEGSTETAVDLAGNEFLLKNLGNRVAFPSDLIKKLRLKTDEKVWTIVHNGSLKLGKGNVPYSKFQEGRSYKPDTTGQIKVGEKVFDELGLTLDNLKANIKRGVITVMEI